MTNMPFVIGALAQVVEHRTENPCVPGSNPGGTTKKTCWIQQVFFYIGSFGALEVLIRFRVSEFSDFSDYFYSNLAISRMAKAITATAPRMTITRRSALVK